MKIRMTLFPLFLIVIIFLSSMSTFAQHKSREERQAECNAERRREGRPGVCVFIEGRGSGSGTGSGNGTGSGRDRPTREYIDKDYSSQPSPGRGGSGIGGVVNNRNGIISSPRGNGTAFPKQTFLNRLSGDGQFTAMVVEGNGQIPISIMQDLKPLANPVSVSSVILTRQVGANGHRYITLNFLGRDLDLQTTWGLVSRSLGRVFPISKVNLVSGQGIAVGNEFNLIAGGVPNSPTFIFPVVVTSVTPYSFTFTTKPTHWLKGSATHGIVRDADGNVWLFQEGNGVTNENWGLQTLNYALADVMWMRMAYNIRSLLGR